MTNTGYTPEEPIAAIATALAPGAIGIVRVSGKGSIELVSKVFSRPEALLNAKGYSLVYGWITAPEKIDEVMAGVYRAPKSFTGEDMVEIFCHGGISVVTTIHKILLANGFRQAERGEFTFRAYINGKTDLTKAEAVREIIDSKTDTSRGRAAGRLAGNLYEEIDSIKKYIVDTLAEIEVGIEYPEDEETIADSFDTGKLIKVKERLSSLAASWKSEKLYQDGARVVLCGKTNAGKSSLFNALLKEERAIVSDIEGTTRDWLESWVSFDGIPARLFDTAGLRKTDDVIEAKGVEITRDLSKEADLILYLIDSNAGITKEDCDFITSQKNIPLIIVLNKCDKADADSIKIPEELSDFKKVMISAKNSSGLESLTLTVKELLFKDKSTAPNQAGLGSARQKVSIEEALERINHALEISQNDEYGLDAVVQDLEDSLDSLGEVTGEITPDDVLGSIFANFCVGK
ncbi:tRNA uridine-5-carboxymethylaminomethyl(34) synthesis GTPase MnmE [Treponema sp.]|uniref:tRNA uridine-5-carboxymethylaminomethyl(34) synthesis GTPase MnmE n=1 Tax=Treponema sp. TaxID=166 RepID=UPI0025E5B785|nr:tRNA uridine-5-carboxymethylaminomethyl(34) synthesis GTPase MnmE [Treponema sp.]MCR5218726.1 tRNA uridine-5-carboxymethylaminomethyl(34) synthesis GTPase MnmE [Treponema sp.]